MRASEAGAKTHIVQGGRLSRYGLRTFALGYLALILIVPVALIFFKAFEDGFMHAVESVTTPDALHAFYLTIVLVLIAVPLNTIFGIACAIVLVRHNFRGKAILNALIDLPFAVSPVVIGLSLVLVYGSIDGWFGPWLADHGIQIIFSPPGMALATIFVSLPFVVREVQPVLQEIGDEQEQAASTLGASGWQTFWRVTLPSIRWGVTYGVVLGTARALGEFGAVAVVSGKISGSTETATIFVEKQYEHFNVSGAYAAALVLAVLALMTLFAMNLIQRRDRKIVAPSVVAEPTLATAGENPGKEAPDGHQG
jgi:sulfate transport system permease protein